jgi:2-polyprenyl-3-methyl-5-hydroxy-6-metoxy-1,4-benzoquinol methylase
MRLQPGVQRFLEELLPVKRVLDLGCGNGELWRTLHERGYRGEYVGVDFSDELLQIAASPYDNAPIPNQAIFIQADISVPGWEKKLPSGKYDMILAFAVLHHIPSRELRLDILRKVRAMIQPKGTFIHSEWQFMNSQRLRKRLQPWDAISLSDDQVEPGDYLLDWRHGGYGYRYVHHFDEDELIHLATESDFNISSTFLSDGEGGKLGIYQVWTPKGTSR